MNNLSLASENLLKSKRILNEHQRKRMFSIYTWTLNATRLFALPISLLINNLIDLLWRAVAGRRKPRGATERLTCGCDDKRVVILVLATRGSRAAPPLHNSCSTHSGHCWTQMSQFYINCRKAKNIHILKRKQP